jgi:hypothetical protein
MFFVMWTTGWTDGEEVVNAFRDGWPALWRTVDGALSLGAWDVRVVCLIPGVFNKAVRRGQD